MARERPAQIMWISSLLGNMSHAGVTPEKSAGLIKSESKLLCLREHFDIWRF